MLTLGITALVASVVLFVISKKFAVEEDPRIGQIAAILPQANCGGCGFPGCPGFAAALVKAATEKGSIDGLSCPVGNNAQFNARILLAEIFVICSKIP